jgi:hypothetical protein
MRRVGFFFLTIVAAIALAPPDALAQPKVTITGFMDTVSSYTKNLSMEDLNPARTGDSEWYARTRVRPDIVAEVGTTKFVLGLEIDYVYGQTAGQDTSVCLSAACPNDPQRFGSSAGLDQNTDTPGILELKWAYTEFRIPLLPFVSVMRVGAQPYAFMYKAGTLATGDFPGVHVTMQFTPMLRGVFTWTQIEEESTGARDGFIRGEDFAIFAGVEITPFKGLDILPLFSYANFEGVTNGQSRRQRGGVGTGAGIYPLGAIEDRFTVGVDSRWRFGAFNIDPTILYQFGSRDQVRGGVLDNLTRDAWYIDVRGGWRAGPLLIEGAAIYTTGNKAEDRLDLHPDIADSPAVPGRSASKIKHFETISTDRGFFSGWCEITCSNIDYSNRFRAQAANLDLGHSTGYDKYGLIRLGVRASYAVTPTFTVRGAANVAWTAEEVDTSSAVSSALGVAVGDANGDKRHYGTEASVGFQWRFAPNVALDGYFAYFWTGTALRAATIANIDGVVSPNASSPEDVQTLGARIRYSF